MVYTRAVCSSEIAAGFTALRNGNVPEFKARCVQVAANVATVLEKRYIDFASTQYRSGKFRLAPEDYDNPNYKVDKAHILCFASEYKLQRRWTGSQARVQIVVDSNRSALPAQIRESETQVKLLVQGCLEWAKVHPIKVCATLCIPVVSCAGAYFSSYTILKGVCYLSGVVGVLCYSAYNLLDP